MRAILPVSYRGAVKPSLSQANQGSSLADGLISFWLLNNLEGQQIYDATPRRMPATAPAAGNAIGFSPSPYGMAAAFDGGDYIDVGNGPNSHLSLPITVIAKVKQTTTAAAGKSAGIYNTNAGAANPTYRGFCIQILSSGTLHLFVGANSGTTFRGKTGATTFPLNTWKTVGGTIADTVSDIHVYLDGKDDGGSLTGTSGITMGYSTQNAAIGGPALSQETLKGQVAWVAVWNRKLSAEEHLFMHINPMSLFEQRPLWVAPTTGLVLPSVSAAGSSSVSGALSRIIPISGTATGAASVSGTLRTTTNFTGTAAGSTTITSNFVHPPPVALLFTCLDPGVLSFSCLAPSVLSFACLSAGALTFNAVSPSTNTLTFSQRSTNTLTFIPVQNLE